MKVFVLEKTNGSWTPAEVNAIVAGQVEVESLPRLPNRLVAINKPLTGKNFKQLLGHSNFTEREVDYVVRWD
ncbi:MAG: hypothetical protein PHY34_05315 [Patescibacteria group bacterium]|nr:hypothetical protein [Patescibacteria group bacterium]MDD5716025.1 hypothetical protein [Patescibacteria group bacterium]